MGPAPSWELGALTAGRAQAEGGSSMLSPALPGRPHLDASKPCRGLVRGPRAAGSCKGLSLCRIPDPEPCCRPWELLCCQLGPAAPHGLQAAKNTSSSSCGLPLSPASGRHVSAGSRGCSRDLGPCHPEGGRDRGRGSSFCLARSWLLEGLPALHRPCLSSTYTFFKM